VLRVSSLWFGKEAAQHELFGQLQGLLGKDGSMAVEAIVTSAANQPRTGWWATCLAMVTLSVAVTGVFVELQDALNTIWKIKRLPGHGIWQFVKDRLLSFAMVLGIAFLLLVSLVVSAGLSGLGQFTNSPGSHWIWTVVNFTVSLGIITVLFAMILKVLPDARIAWRDVWLGGFITALLFNLGKFLLGFYLGRSSVTSAYGAAGSLVIILLWVYYSAQILFFGAELTRVYADHFGSHVKAAAGAELLTEAKSKPSTKTPRKHPATA
jgi:membrane protein